MEAQVRRFAEIRQAAGDDMDIAKDFHGRLSPDIAIQVIQGIQEYYPLFVEEACLPNFLIAEHFGMKDRRLNQGGRLKMQKLFS